jgi:hypothetical protein
MWPHLSQPEIGDDTAYTDTVRRVAGRLGEYTELLVRPLNLRPTGANLLAIDGERIEVRISSPSGHVVLVVAPDADIAGEVFWLRAMATRSLPAHRLVTHDVSGLRVPFSYAILNFLGGAALGEQHDEALIRVAARAVGRAARRAHQISAPGFGRPTAAGRWPTLDWPGTLRAWLEGRGALALAADLLDNDTVEALVAATLEHPDLQCEQPRLLHGALSPARARVTAGESIQLEALTRPGPIVAGDPLLDVALALLPGHPAAFRQGFLEGYAAAGPLEHDQRIRLRRLGLLALLADAAEHPSAERLGRLPALVQAELRLIEQHDDP